MANISKPSKDNMDQIRELIFGEQSRENHRKFSSIEGKIKEVAERITTSIDDYNQKFKDVEKNTQKMQNHLESHIDNMKNELKKIIQSTESQLSKQIDLLTQDKTDRLELGNFLIELGIRIKGEDLLDTIKKEAAIKNNE